MATQSNNPFVLPGFGQPGELGQNPVLASMEMMRQTWQNLAGLGGLDTGNMMSAALSPEDLERRISDLRAVENWLRMNLSMLSSTIQGMEVQRATFTTLRSFVETAQASAGNAPEGVSPLEAVLGIRRGQSQAGGQASAEPAESGQPAAGEDASQAANRHDAAGDTEQAMAGATAAAQGWWNMLQQQFDTLAAATSATLQGAEALKAAGMAGAAETASSGQAEAGKAPARKTAARKAAPAKKAAARKTAPKSAVRTTKSPKA